MIESLQTLSILSLLFHPDNEYLAYICLGVCKIALMTTYLAFISYSLCKRAMMSTQLSSPIAFTSVQC